MVKGSLIADTLEFLVFGWILLIHGIMVCIPSVFFGFIIYGFQIIPAVQLGVYITLFSLAFSTPVLIYGMLKEVNSEGFVGHYIITGYPVGAGVLIINAVGLSFYRLWLLVTQLPPPVMPSALSGAIGVTFFAVLSALVVGVAVGIKSKRVKLQQPI